MKLNDLFLSFSDLGLIREINLDKLREWKPFYKEWRYRGISSQLFSDRKSGNDKNKFIAHEDMTKLGYEVYADGPTRVLRICESFNSRRRHLPVHSSEKIRVRISHFVGNLLETKVSFNLFQSDEIVKFCNLYFTFWLEEKWIYGIKEMMA